MKTSLLRNLDTIVGLPAAIVAGLCPRPSTRPPERPGHIVVVKLFGMGSIFLLSAPLQNLREQYPDIRISLVTFAANRDVTRLLTVFDDVITVDSSTPATTIIQAMKAMYRLRRQDIDLVVDLEYFSKLSTLFCRLATSAHVRGFLLPAFWRRRLLDSGITFREDIHFSESCARLLNKWCQWQQRLNVKVLPQLTDKEKKEVQAIFSMTGRGKRRVLINPNANDMCLERRWPLENFRTLIEELAILWPDTVFCITGSGKEVEWCGRLHELIPENLHSRVFMIAGMTSSIVALAGILEKGHMLITNDTGIMHVGAAVNIPIVALFGPESPVRYGPLMPELRCRIVSEPVPCGPCLSYMNKKRPPCMGDNICMKGLSVRKVLDACLDLEESLPPAFTPESSKKEHRNKQQTSRYGDSLVYRNINRQRKI